MSAGEESKCGCGDPKKAGNPIKKKEGKETEWVTEVQDQSQLQEIIAAAQGGIVVIDFFASWCGPCRQIAPQIARLAKQRRDISFVKVNSDSAPELAAEHNVQGLPTFSFYKNGQPVPDYAFAGADFRRLVSVLDALEKEEEEDEEEAAS